jgi:hypothetical protein
MAKTPAQARLDEVVAKALTPILKAAGYRKQGRTFRRKHANCVSKMSACSWKRLTVVGLFAFSALSRAEQEVTINAVRPVEAALDKLEKELRVPITHEEGPYFLTEDTRDTKPRELRFSYSPIALTKSEIKAAIQSVVDANNNSVSPPMIFKIEYAGGRFHVYPSKIKDASGEYVAYISPLDTVISVKPKDRSGLEFFKEFQGVLFQASLTSVANSGGVEGVFGGPPPTKVGGENIKARELLIQYSLEDERRGGCGGKYSWRLLCDSAWSCTLSHYFVRSYSPEPECPVVNARAKFEILGPMRPQPPGTPGVIGAGPGPAPKKVQRKGTSK